MIHHYILDAHGEPVPEPDLLRWAQWLEAAWPSRRVARTEVNDIHVSTVFLGIDYDWYGGGPPVLFETMIFGGEWDQHQWRHHTRAEAIAKHDQIVAALRAGHSPEDDS